MRKADNGLTRIGLVAAHQHIAIHCMTGDFQMGGGHILKSGYHFHLRPQRALQGDNGGFAIG